MDPTSKKPDWSIHTPMGPLVSCKLNGVDPEAYLADVLTKLVDLWPAARLDELMP